MRMKSFIRSLGVLILSSLIFLNGCEVNSHTTIEDNSSPVSLKKIKNKIAGNHSGTSADGWGASDSVFDDPQVTVSTGNFWDRLRGSFQLNHYSDNPKVKSQINWFLHHQGYLNRSVKRASPYMYYIFEQVQKRNLPGEVLLLPFIESAFNPFAYSGPGAAGLWQIMPQTGSGFGLKQNWWYDGRRDIHASTNAALDYLTYLQSYFDGDWLLAIAAYNTGEGTVQQCVRRNARCCKNTDFFSLGLCQETQAYVPRLLALAEIISNPDEYSITLPAVRDEPYLAEVKVDCQIDLTEAAQLAGISQDEMRRLNPAYRHKLTRPHSSCKLLLPINNVETFKRNLTQLSVVNHTSLQRYRVKRGETLESIAAHFQVSSIKLRHINHLRTQRVRTGRYILVPVDSPIITGNAQSSDKSSVERSDNATEHNETSTKQKDNDISAELQKELESQDVNEKPQHFIKKHHGSKKSHHSQKMTHKHLHKNPKMKKHGKVTLASPPKSQRMTAKVSKKRMTKIPNKKHHVRSKTKHVRKQM